MNALQTRAVFLLARRLEEHSAKLVANQQTSAYPIPYTVHTPEECLEIAETWLSEARDYYRRYRGTGYRKTCCYNAPGKPSLFGAIGPRLAFPRRASDLANL